MWHVLEGWKKLTEPSVLEGKVPRENMASDHLWHDLGLWSRPDLVALMRRNLPARAARNVKDMKWKRFLYKQPCEAEGVYTCCSPSCEVCSDYRVCFGPDQ
jgi:nitrogen fixation protein NifQ